LQEEGNHKSYQQQQNQDVQLALEFQESDNYIPKLEKKEAPFEGVLLPIVHAVVEIRLEVVQVLNEFEAIHV